MKKKIIALCLTVCLAAVAVVGGTLAYFTDTDEATNVMTMGNVKIDLTEENRDGTKFTQNQTLLPIVGSAQDDSTKDENGISTAENYIPKIINVTNTGNQDAYVRIVFAFPAAFDDAQSAANMMVHWNYLKSEPDGTWSRVDNSAKVTIDGVEYNLYTYTYNAKLAPEAETAYPAVAGIYMDARVDAVQNDDNTITYSIAELNKTATVSADYNFELHAFAQAVQAEGFDTAEAAFAASFGNITADNNPWETTPAPTAD